MQAASMEQGARSKHHKEQDSKQDSKQAAGSRQQAAGSRQPQGNPLLFNTFNGGVPQGCHVAANSKQNSNKRRQQTGNLGTLCCGLRAQLFCHGQCRLLSTAPASRDGEASC